MGVDLVVKGVRQVRPHTRGGKPVRGYTVMTYGGGRYGSVGFYGKKEDAERHVKRLMDSGAWSGMPPKIEVETESPGNAGYAGPRRIATTYDVVTPESAEAGDYAERGWDDEEGESMEPDEYDLEEKLSAVDKAARWLLDRGALEASSSHYHSGIWYTQSDPEIDYATGAERRQSYHLKGFSEEEERMIHGKVTAKKGMTNVAPYTRAGRTVKAHIRSHADAMNFLGKRDRKKVASHTYAERRGDDVAIKYHATDVVTFHPDDSATLRTGGWRTVTTKRRIGQHVPAAGVSQVKGEWSTAHGTPFAEGIRVSTKTGHESHCRRCGSVRAFNEKLGAPNPCNCSAKKAVETVVVKSVETVAGIIGILAHLDAVGDDRGIPEVAAHLTDPELQQLQKGLVTVIEHATALGYPRLCDEIVAGGYTRPQAARLASRLTGEVKQKGLRLAVGQAAYSGR